MNRLALAVLLLSSSASLADTQPHPIPEATPNPPAVDLPAVPDLKLPKLPGGARSPLELHVAGAAMSGKRVAVRGYIVYIYDCVAELRAPGQAAAEVQRKIDDDPTLCLRPKFYLGDRRDSRPDDALWIVDVPRAANKLERERLPKDELAKRPPVPRLVLGDYVEVTGDFAASSAHGDVNADGLVSYVSLAHVAPPTREDRVAIAVDVPRPTMTPPPPRAITPPDAAAKTESVRHANAATHALASKQWDTAIDEYTKATAAWPDNALAWYGLGGADAQKRAWSDAVTAFNHCVAIAPDQPMYEMWAGIAHYEAAIDQARQAQARAQNTPPERVVVDTSAIDFDVAEDRLSIAASLVPEMWRAHYYLGRIARERQHWHTAAEQFAAAIRANPHASGPFIALAKLYERWQMPDLVLAITTAGTANVVAVEAVDLWYLRGVALDDKGQLADAVKAYGQALDQPGDHWNAKFARGRDEWKLHDDAAARKDLTQFLSAGSGEFMMGQARIILAQLK